MTREDIIRMARMAGGLNCDCCLPEPEPHEMQEFIESFAELVAQQERDECAKVAETPIYGEQDDMTMAAKDRIAAAIRARKEK